MKRTIMFNMPNPLIVIPVLLFFGIYFLWIAPNVHLVGPSDDTANASNSMAGEAVQPPNPGLPGDEDSRIDIWKLEPDQKARYQNTMNRMLDNAEQLRRAERATIKVNDASFTQSIARIETRIYSQNPLLPEEMITKINHAVGQTAKNQATFEQSIGYRSYMALAQEDRLWLDLLYRIWKPTPLTFIPVLAGLFFLLRSLLPLFRHQ